jgi:hypothetical protein
MRIRIAMLNTLYDGAGLYAWQEANSAVNSWIWPGADRAEKLNLQFEEWKRCARICGLAGPGYAMTI